MAKQTGLGDYLAVDDSGGTPRDLSNDIGDYGINIAQELVETTGLDKSARERITGMSDGDVSLTYVAKRIGNGWKLIDVIVDDGISELTVRKSEYRRVLASDGVEGLIAALESKAGELIAQ